MTRRQQRHLRGHPPAAQGSQVSDHSLRWSPAIPTRWGAAGSQGWCQRPAAALTESRGGSQRKNPAGPESCFLLLFQQAAGMTCNRALVGRGASEQPAAAASSSAVHRTTNSGCWRRFDSSKMATLGCSHIFRNSHSFLTSRENSVSTSFTSLEHLPSINTS